MSKLLSEADHKRVTAAVTAAEAQCDGEIVTIIAAQSHLYRDVALWWMILAMLLVPFALTFMSLPDLERLLGWNWSVEPVYRQLLHTIIGGQIVVGVIMQLLLGTLRVRLAFTPHGLEVRRVRQRAVEYFKAAAEKRTVGLTGILIYLSLAERRAEIVADEAIFELVDEAIWKDSMDALVAQVRAGDPAGGMVAAIEHVGIVLAEHFPKSDGNPNELPDRLIEV